jgi:hypothetical protein
MIAAAMPDGTSYRDHIPSDGPARLKTFVEMYLDGVAHPTDDRRGVDLIYRIVHAVSDTTQVREHASGSAWRTFVALNPSRQLAYDSETAELCVLPLLADAATVNVVAIEAVSLNEHRVICQQYFDRLSAELPCYEVLGALLKDFRSETYPMWLRTLRLAKPPMDKEWGKFRQQALLELFRGRLAALKVPHERVEQLVVQLQRDHENLMLTKSEDPATAQAGSALGVAQPLSKDQKERRTREALHAVVDRLTYEQMLNLSVPLGAVFDLIHTPQSQ